MSKGGPIASHIDIRTALNVPNNEKLSSLFCRGISDGEKKFYEMFTWPCKTLSTFNNWRVTGGSSKVIKNGAH